MKNKKGFTLIEILVVIGIIGALLIFLLPHLLGTQDSSKNAGVKSTMHNLQLAIESYNSENLIYPLGTNVPLKKLFDDYLAKAGYMGTLPNNPFTGKPYSETDTAGKIIYSFDEATGVYTIVGYKKNGTTELLKLTNL